MKYFIDKLNITTMEVEDSAGKGLLAMLKTQGWKEFEPSYYCKEHGEVKNGLCECFKTQKSPAHPVLTNEG